MWGRGDSREWLTVVGVVDDIRQLGPTQKLHPAVYQPYLQVGNAGFLSGVTYVVRTASDPTGTAPALRDVLRSMDKDQPAAATGLMKDVVHGATATPAFYARLLGIFAVLALALALVGTYGVIAYSVAQRSHEIGLRMALGAQDSRVVSMVLLRTGRLALAGVVIGGAAAWAATGFLQTLLFEITPTDPATFAAVTLAIFTAAMLAGDDSGASRHTGGSARGAAPRVRQGTSPLTSRGGFSAPRSLSPSDNPNPSAGGGRACCPPLPQRRGAGRPFGKWSDTDPLPVDVDALDLERARHPDRDLAGPVSRPIRGKRRGVRQRFDARLELDERPELRDAGHAPAAHLTDLVGRRHPRPRILGELLHPERDLLLVVVNPQHLDGDLVAGFDRPSTRPRPATSPSRRRAAGPARRRRDR